MRFFFWPYNLFSNLAHKGPQNRVLSINEQIRFWYKANRKMNWGITRDEFEKVEASSRKTLNEDDRVKGFIGLALFYGFGDDGYGYSDAVLSGKLVWEYACASRNRRTWQCEYVNFNKPRDIRLRPGAPARPKGFYSAKIQFGVKFKAMNVSQVRKKMTNFTGWGPEGFQFLCITHPHFVNLMNERKIPFMALADYDVAPYGYNDFFDAPQMFCSNNILGLGIGNVDRNYPLFEIPTLRFLKGINRS
jgi:hypothetical protein